MATAPKMQNRAELSDYSHYKFEYEENQTHLHIEGILGKQGRSEGSRAPGDNKRGTRTPNVRKRIKLIWCTGKGGNVPPLTGKDVESQMGLSSTELRVYKVRGAKTASRR